MDILMQIASQTESVTDGAINFNGFQMINFITHAMHV